MSISVVTHGHGTQVLELLRLLSRSDAVVSIRRVWVTVNVPEALILDALKSDGLDERDGRYLLGELRVHVVANEQPLGFGANHNQAFRREQAQANPADFFVVMNPDVSWDAPPWAALLAAAMQPQAGCAYPVQMAPQGEVQDFRRALPSPLALWHRHARKDSRRVAEEEATDWINAAMLLFPAKIYAEIGGFDDRYHMYCEDVDICLRLQLAGYRLVAAPNARVTHVARRASRNDVRHFAWHVRSLFRLWLSSPYRSFIRQRDGR